MSRKLKPIDHGTNRGYVMHIYRKIPACKPCLAAHSEYIQSRPVAHRSKESIASASRTKYLANKRLRQAHPEEYKRYYAQARLDVTEERQ